MLLILILTSVVITIVEGIPLARNKHWKEFYIMIIILVISLTLWSVKEIFMFTPLQVLKNLLYPVGKSIFK